MKNTSLAYFVAYHADEIFDGLLVTKNPKLQGLAIGLLVYNVKIITKLNLIIDSDNIEYFLDQMTTKNK